MGISDRGPIGRDSLDLEAGPAVTGQCLRSRAV